MPHEGITGDAARQPIKRCGRCGASKPHSEFYVHRGQKSGKHGLQSYCKACASSDAVRRAKDHTPAQKQRCREWKREWLKTPKGKVSLATAARRYKKKNPHKRMVREFTSLAIKLGVLIRPDGCSECGKPGVRYANGRFSIEAHHPDHSKPLDVVWLCVPCHRKADKEATR
jgi:hypothetical protein